MATADPFAVFYSQTAVGRPGEGAGTDAGLGLWPKEYPDAEVVALPRSESLSRKSLWRVLASRRSRRSWRVWPMRYADLGVLCEQAAGVTGFMEAYGFSMFPQRAFPSPGGLQSTEMYIAYGEHVFSDAPQSEGVFHYRAVGHRLERLAGYGVTQGVVESLRRQQPWFDSGVPLLVVLTVDYARLRRKYGVAAGRLAAMEVGWLGQNIYLVGEALDLSICALNGADDNAVAQMLGFGMTIAGEYPMLVIGVGPGPSYVVE